MFNDRGHAQCLYFVSIIIGCDCAEIVSLHRCSNPELIQLVTIELLSILATLLSIFGISNHKSTVCIDGAQDVVLGARADPNESLIGFLLIDETEGVRLGDSDDSHVFSEVGLKDGLEELRE